MQSQRPSEAGHTGLGFATLMAGIALAVLTLGAARSNPILAWIGGVGAALLFIAQFTLLHAEIGNLWRHTDQLERRRE